MKLNVFTIADGVGAVGAPTEKDFLDNNKRNFAFHNQTKFVVGRGYEAFALTGCVPSRLEELGRRKFSFLVEKWKNSLGGNFLTKQNVKV